MPADLLERVQLAVVVLHGMDVIVGAPGQQDGGKDAQHDDDNDQPTDQHRPLFNRISGALNTAPREPSAEGMAQNVEATAAGGYEEDRRGRMSSGMSSRPGLLWSRFERIGSVTPQSAPTAGSSQARPSSSEAS